MQTIEYAVIVASGLFLTEAYPFDHDRWTPKKLESFVSRNVSQDYEDRSVQDVIAMINQTAKEMAMFAENAQRMCKVKRVEPTPLFAVHTHALHEGEQVYILSVDTYCQSCNSFREEARYLIKSDDTKPRWVNESDMDVLKSHNSKAVEVLCDSHHGVNIPKIMGTRLVEGGWEGIDKEDLNILGDEYHEAYWEVWESVLQNATYKDDKGLWRLHQDGDLFCYCEEIMGTEQRKSFLGE